MEFMEKLQKQKEEAKAAYIKARNEWEETITAENIKGDFEKWKTLCDRKALRRASLARKRLFPGFDSPACFSLLRDIIKNRKVVIL